MHHFVERAGRVHVAVLEHKDAVRALER